MSAVRRDKVGPPDPISNIRPVIYDDLPADSSAPSHPYSLREFTGDPREYQWKVQKQELDAFNHNFWTDVSTTFWSTSVGLMTAQSNTRFNAALEARLSSLPESSTPLDKEFAASEFYASWLAQEETRLQAYNAEWRKRNWANITLEARLKYQKFLARIGLGGGSA